MNSVILISGINEIININILISDINEIINIYNILILIIL